MGQAAAKRDTSTVFLDAVHVHRSASNLVCTQVWLRGRYIVYFNAHRPRAENKRGRRTTRSVATSMRMPRETKLKNIYSARGGGATRPNAHPAETSSPGVPPSRVRYSAAQARLIRNCPQWTRAPSTISPSPTRLDSNDSRSALKLRWCAAPPKSAQRHSFGGAHCTSPFGCLSATPHLGVERREIGGFGRG